MNIRVIISGRPGVNHADDHKSLAEVSAMDDLDLAAWIRSVIATGQARGEPKIAREAAR